MARIKKRIDIYNQPGLFDEIYHENVSAESSLIQEPSSSYRQRDTDDSSATPLDKAFLSTEIATERIPLRFISFGSGSSGNSAYLGTEKYGIIIDAGIDAKKVEKDLAAQGIDMFKVVGIIITHDHHDHVSHVYDILRHYRHIALYCTPRMMNGLQRRHGISRRVREYHRPIYKETPFNIKDFKITAFEVSHDGSDNAGYIIEYNRHRFVVATDMGTIGERAEFYMKQATALMMESDYDCEMLRKGHYPQYLKARIAAERGHLSNDQVAEFLRNSWNDKMKNIFLCHLSKDNNTPILAKESAHNALIAAGASSVGNASEDLENRDAPVQLYALPRFDASPLFYLR